MKRPALMTLLAVLHFIGAAFLLTMGSSELWEFPFDRGRREMFDTEIAALAIVFGIAGLACGAGLWRLKRYGRRLQIALAALWLFLFPVGTVVGAVVLFYMWTPGIRALFSDPNADFTRAELTTTLMVVGASAVIGTLYVATRPARIKARIAANEAAAIGSMRSILSAEVSFAAAGGGGYSTRLEWLAIPCKGMRQGFLSSDLAKDPARKSGYIFRLASAGAGEGVYDCHGAPTEADFYATAEPMNHDTGKRAFSASAVGVLYEAPELPPSAVATVGGTATPVK